MQHLNVMVKGETHLLQNLLAAVIPVAFLGSPRYDCLKSSINCVERLQFTLALRLEDDTACKMQHKDAIGICSRPFVRQQSQHMERCLV